MLFFIGGGLLIGALLGARFTVLAVIPGVMVALGLATIAGFGTAADWGLIHLTALIVFVQVGYLGRAFLRLFGASHGLVRQRRPIGNVR